MKKVSCTSNFATNLHRFWIAIPGTQNIRFSNRFTRFFRVRKRDRFGIGFYIQFGCFFMKKVSCTPDFAMNSHMFSMVISRTQNTKLSNGFNRFSEFEKGIDLALAFTYNSDTFS